MSINLPNAPQEFLHYFKEGKDAARAGRNAKARELFRRAVEIDPYREQVWLWLASVVDTDEDRRVCFENVLELNPANPTARRQLQKQKQRALEEALAAPAPDAAQHGKSPPNRQPRKLSRVRRLFRLLLLILIVIASIIAGSVILYA